MNKLIYSKTLYSRASNNKLLEWTIKVTQTNEKPRHAIMLIESGYVNGNMKQHEHQYVVGKNIGRSNETDGLGQALEEAQSRKRKQINKGYRDLTLKEAETELGGVKLDRNNRAKPMKAKLYKTGICEFPQIAQKKYNGVRAELGFREQNDGLFGKSYIPYLLSQEGKDYVVPTNMKNYLINLLHDHPELKDIKLDGEVYNHDMYLQEIQSAIKKENENSDRLYYVTYDIKTDNIQTIRTKELESVHSTYFNTNRFVLLAKNYMVDDEQEAHTLADKFIKWGYEGAILRDPNAKYVSTRTKSLLKIKKVYNKDFIIRDVIPTDRDNYNNLPIGLLVCENEVTGKTFKVTPKASKEHRYSLLVNKHKYIGTYINVEYREVSKDKVPIHAVGIFDNLK